MANGRLLSSDGSTRQCGLVSNKVKCSPSDQWQQQVKIRVTSSQEHSLQLMTGLVVLNVRTEVDDEMHI